jgi:hypothetical protein
MSERSQTGLRMPTPADTPEHRRATHRRWVATRNRDTASPEYQDAWYGQQCGACWFYVPLAGSYGYDWGVCTNAQAPFDGRAMFEHDGCEHHRPAGDSATSYADGRWDDD